MSAAATPTATEAPSLELDERDAEPRTPMKRLGSTRKLAAFSNIRLQLTEQTRVLEARADAAAGVANELSDYCRRRADLEHEYARALDKLTRAAHQRHKDQKHKREQWPLTSAFPVWQAALEQTRALAKDHAALGELYAGPLAARLQRAADDALRLHRKCRDIVQERHEELSAALVEAGAAGKTHAAAAAEWRAAALKLRHAYDARETLAAAQPARPKKLKALDKELEKRVSRHSEARARAVRARADYVLSLEAANATLQRYFLDDVADIMLCMEVGFEAVVQRVCRAAGAAEVAAGAAAGAAGAALTAAGEALDAALDRHRLVAAHASAFAPPRPLGYRGAQPADQDTEMRELISGAAPEQDEASEATLIELGQRLQQLDACARQLRAECRENAKTLDAAEAELVRQMEGSDIDVTTLFGPEGVPVTPAPPEDEAARRDQEDYYLAKFRSYVSGAGRLARIESKATAVRTRLGVGGGQGGRVSPPTPPRRALRRGLFAAPLHHDLPTVLTACVRVISTYGLRHQGIFRVSGSQVEMQALRAAFERGEDPLRDVRDASDINSVCGLLKLYLRELRPPLVPSAVGEALLRVASGPLTTGQLPAGSGNSDVARMRAALATLPIPHMLVLRYLMAFLAHLTEYSESNMMDAWNLAICLGPTLMAARGEGGAQVTAQNLVNEVVKRLILHHAEIFPQDIAPHTLYSKFSSALTNDVSPVEEADEPDGDGSEAEPDPRDDLSLYADDDDDLSEDGESGEWPEREAAPHNRSNSVERQIAAPLQVPEPAVASSSQSTLNRRLAETTPDLVLDLPARGDPLAGDPPQPSPAPADSADTFAHNRDTLKKRPAHKHTNSDSSTEVKSEGEPSTEPVSEPEGACGGSPVPARNTARVAAKFADLTLTGGSLKPALAAKPALLRRPTPHPQHARPAPPQPPPDAAC